MHARGFDVENALIPSALLAAIKITPRVIPSARIAAAALGAVT